MSLAMRDLEKCSPNTVKCFAFMMMSSSDDGSTSLRLNWFLKYNSSSIMINFFSFFFRLMRWAMYSSSRCACLNCSGVSAPVRTARDTVLKSVYDIEFTW